MKWMDRFAALSAAAVLLACSGGGGEDNDVADGAGLDIRQADSNDNSGQDNSVADQTPLDQVSDLEDTADSDGATQPPDGWVPVQLSPSKDLLGVWGDSSTLIAVGTSGTALWRQNGVWTPMAFPVVRDIHAVYGESIEDVYAVGAGGTVCRFDGTQWEKVDHNIEGLDNVTLRGVWGESGHLFVVGDLGTVLHKAGPQWAKEQSLVTYPLQAAWGPSLLDVLAGGGGGAVLSRTSDVWTSTQVASGAVFINAIHGLASGLVVVGGSQGVIAVRDGPQFEQMLSNDAFGRAIRGVWAYTEGDVWLLGRDGLLIHSEAGKWNVREIAGPYYRNASFNAVWGAAEGEPADATAVGDQGAMLRFNGSDWLDEPSGPVVDFSDLVGRSSQDMVATGHKGLVMLWNGSQWFGTRAVTSQNVMGAAIWKEGYLAVGEEGAIIKIQQQSQLTGTIPAASGIRGLCSSEKQVVAVGKLGAVYVSTDGIEFTKVDTGVFDTLNDCVIDSQGVTTVAGEAGRILRIKDGQTGTVAVATLANLNRIALAADDEVVAVGDNGVVLRGKGSSMKRVYEQPGLFLYGVTVTNDKVLAVGWAGKVIELSGESVETYEVSEAGILTQIWGSDGDIWTVGRGGRMFRQKTL